MTHWSSSTSRPSRLTRPATSPTRPGRCRPCWPRSRRRRPRCPWRPGRGRGCRHAGDGDAVVIRARVRRRIGDLGANDVPDRRLLEPLELVVAEGVVEVRADDARGLCVRERVAGGAVCLEQRLALRFVGSGHLAVGDVPDGPAAGSQERGREDEREDGRTHRSGDPNARSSSLWREASAAPSAPALPGARARHSVPASGTPCRR